jgi:phosphoribulokinase
MAARENMLDIVFENMENYLNYFESLFTISMTNFLNSSD